MATVYLAIQENFQRKVALKIMSPALSADESFSERFLREARIVSQLVHPNIVTVHDVGIQNGHHYLSMEYIEGEDLKDSLPRFNGAQLFRVIEEVAKALDYAGRKGYVHRDVKPENIMVHNQDGRAVLMDFGIARATDAANSMTQTGTALGTPHFMSPEQARGQPIDGRSDLYGLGVLLFYLLVGKVPYEADSPVAVGIKHVSAPIPQLPSALSCYQFLIDKLMAKLPKDRYQHGSEVVEAVAGINVVPLDQWRDTQGVEYLGSNEPTPVRTSEQVRPEQVSAQNAELQLEGDRPVDPPVSADLSMEMTGETIHIPPEDLHGRVPQTSGRRWILLPLILLLAGGAFFVYQPEQAGNLAKDFRDKLVTAIDGKPVVGSELAGGDRDASEEQPKEGFAENPSEDSNRSAEMATAEASSAVIPVTEAAQAAPYSDKESSGTTISGDGSEVIADEAPEPDPFVVLMAKAKSLHEELALQPEGLAELISLYRELEQLSPGDSTVEKALRDLRVVALESVAGTISEGQLTNARQLLSRAAGWFPELLDDLQYQALDETVAVAERVSALVQQAQEHLAKNRLVKPAGNNARDAYQQVLALDPANTDATKGLATIIKRYAALAASRLQRSEYEQALVMVDRGLSIQADDKALLALRSQIQQEQQRENNLQALLLKAEALTEQGIWFGDGENAISFYLQVLQQQPDRQQAFDGLERIAVKLEQLVEKMLADNNHRGAVVMIDAAAAALPGHERISRLYEKVQAAGPRVDEVWLSGSDSQLIDVEPGKTVRADRTLYIAMKYSQLEQPATVLQAVLYDGARSVNMATVPVVVTGEGGDARFRINRPVEGFPDGGYHLDILLAGEVIFTRAFVIASD